MSHTTKRYFFNYILLVPGLLFLTLSLLFMFNLQLIAGSVLLLLAALFLLNRKVTAVNKEEVTVTVYSEILFMAYGRKMVHLKQSQGKILLIHSKDEQFGIDRKSSTFFTYDVFYKATNNKKTLILTTIFEGHAEQAADFIATHLGLDLEKRIMNG